MVAPAATYTPPTRTAIRKTLGFEPTGPEQAAILDTTGTRILVKGGLQGGKSRVAGQFGTERFFEFPYGPLIIWLAGRKYENTKMEFNYMRDNFLQLGVLDPSDVSHAQETERRWMNLKDDTKVRTLSVDEEMNISMEPPHIVIGCEASELSYEAFLRLWSRANTQEDGLLFLSGTIEYEMGWFPSIADQWGIGEGLHRSYTLESWTNHHRWAGGLDDPRMLEIRDAMGDELFMERYGGVARKPKGLVFGDDFIPAKHVRLIDWIPGLPVSLAIDPGWNQSAHAVLAIQQPPDSPIHVFDGIYSTKMHTGEIIEECQLRPWWVDVPQGDHVIDFQATVNQQSNTHTPVEVWMAKAGISPRSIKIKSIMDGVDRFKAFLRLDRVTLEPLIVIAPRVEGLLSELGMIPNPITGMFQPYHWQLTPDGLYKGLAPHNSNNHAIKALIYWLLVQFGYVMARKREYARTRRW